MRRAVISDVHSNLEALRAVMADIKQQGITEVVCLGDIIGYGPNPCECLELVYGVSICILGNHDQAAIFDPDGFNPLALQAVYWTRSELDRPTNGSDARNRRWDFLGELPRAHQDGKFLFVHGSPRDPTNEYVFPEHVYDSRKMANLFARVDGYCFQGHTHIPGVFTENGEFYSPEECNYCFPLDNRKLMVNVGSVGQPRDSDPRGCYIVLSDDQLEYRRVEYPVEETIRKIYAVPELDNMLGDRLREGR